MIEEVRELLLQDLCARLPYGVEVEYDNCACEVLSIDRYNEELTIWKSPGYRPDVKLEEVKPYLFPLSSMTEEQKKELQELYFDYIPDEIFNDTEFVYHYDCINLIDWLNKNHFDYRGLIPMGLAIDATGLGIY